MNPNQRSQVNGNQGNGYQGNGNQGNGTQRLGTQGLASQGVGSQGNGSQGLGSQGNGSQGSGSVRPVVRGTRGLGDAINVMKNMYKDVCQKKKEEKQKHSKSLKQAKSKEEGAVRFTEQGTKVQKVFFEDKKEMTVSQRVAEASQSHTKMIDNIFLPRVQQKPSTQPVTKNQSSQNISRAQISKPPGPQMFYNVFTDTYQIDNGYNGIFAKEIAQKNAAKLTEIPVNKVAQSSQNSNVSDNKVQKKVTQPTQQNSNQNIFNNIKPLQVQKKPLSEIKEQKSQSVNIFAQHVFSQSTKQTKPVLVFNNNSNSKLSSSINEKKQQTPSVYRPSINLLFNNNGSKVESIKPNVNIFGSVTQQNQQQKQSQSNSTPTFTQYTVTQTVKSNNLNDELKEKEKGQAQIAKNSNVLLADTNNQATYQQQNKKEENKAFRFSFSQPQNNNNLFVSQATQRPFQTQQIQKPNLFNNPVNSKPLLPANNQNNNLFAPQQLKPQLKTNNQTIVPKISLFQNNKSNLFATPQSNVQNQQKTNNIFNNDKKQAKANIFGQKKQEKAPIVEKSQFSNILASQNDNTFGKIPLPTQGGLFNKTQNNNIFAKKSQPEKPSQPTPFNNIQTNNNMFNQKKPQPEKPTQEGGLFNNIQNNNNLFSQTNQSTNMFKNAQKVQEPKQQQESQGNILIQESSKSTNMFLPARNVQTQPQKNNPFGNISQKSSSQSIFGNAPENIFGNLASQNMFGNKGKPGLFDKKEDDGENGPAVFNKKQDESDQEGSGSDGQGYDPENQNAQPQIESGEVFYNYQETNKFAKTEAPKFKLKKADAPLLEQMKLSIEKFKDNKNTYIVVRSSNKTAFFYGCILPKTQIKKFSQNDNGISIAINNIFQTSLLKNNQTSLESWKIMLKKSEDSNKFLQEVQKAIQQQKNNLNKPK